MLINGINRREEYRVQFEKKNTGSTSIIYSFNYSWIFNNYYHKVFQQLRNLNFIKYYFYIKINWVKTKNYWILYFVSYEIIQDNNI